MTQRNLSIVGKIAALLELLGQRNVQAKIERVHVEEGLSKPFDPGQDQDEGTSMACRSYDVVEIELAAAVEVRTSIDSHECMAALVEEGANHACEVIGRVVGLVKICWIHRDCRPALRIPPLPAACLPNNPSTVKSLFPLELHANKAAKEENLADELDQAFHLRFRGHTRGLLQALSIAPRYAPPFPQRWTVLYEEMGEIFLL